MDFQGCSQSSASAGGGEAPIVRRLAKPLTWSQGRLNTDCFLQRQDVSHCSGSPRVLMLLREAELLQKVCTALSVRAGSSTRDKPHAAGAMRTSHRLSCSLFWWRGFGPR